MSMPPTPYLPTDRTPVVESRVARNCGACSSPLHPLGRQAFKTGGPGTGVPDGALLLETFWCAHCGKVELYTTR